MDKTPVTCERCRCPGVLENDEGGFNFFFIETEGRLIHKVCRDCTTLAILAGEEVHDYGSNCRVCDKKADG